MTRTIIGGRILVLADTHNKLPPIIVKFAREADEIWHLGDVCREAIVDELGAVGRPMTIVRGNCDPNLEWPLIVDLTRGALTFRLQHIPPPPREHPGCDVLLHGHTHVPRDETVNGIRFLNPGCVTRPNRGAPPSIAWLKLGKDKSFTWQLLRLP